MIAMAFTIKYKRLFHVELRHNYRLDKGAQEFASLTTNEQEEQLDAYRNAYNLLDDFTLVIPEETRRQLAGLRMLCRTTSTGFFVATEVEESSPGVFTPRITVPAPLRLRFALRLRAPAFMNYTNLSLYAERRQLYHFSNRPRPDGSDIRVFPFLSFKPPSYVTGTAYKTGDLIRRTTTDDTVYMALEDGEHARPDVDPAADAPWRKLTGQGYVNSNDRVLLYPQVFTFAFPSDVSVVEARFVLVDTDGTPYEAGTFISADGQPLQTAALDLRGFEDGLDRIEPGRYRLDVIDQSDASVAYSEQVYIDPELPAEHLFGLVEIFHRSGTTMGAYRLVSAANEMLLSEPESTYVIHFLNRYTYWRYHFANAPAHVPNATDFDTVDALQYVTKASLPLTRSFIELEDDEGKPLPNPTGGLVKPEDGRLFSEVFLLHN